MDKPIYRFDITQNSDEWFAEKVGMFSASSAADLLMDKSTKGYKALINRIVEERITGSRCENILFKGNYATERGHEFEPIAREDYEIRTLQIVKIVGVVIMDKWTLCSPDGLINNDGLQQIKCPLFNTQRDYLKLNNEGKSPITSVYYKQMQFELMVTGREYNIFTSYHLNLKAIDIKVERDNILIEQIKNRLKEAKNEVLFEIEKINNY